ncbi:hypothetical protein Vadar_022268 [Vaccinium darrowii]|uniref:Uncharacterized protein n=1 Tax=Vaccinium darrowii TaxID=229202 RepID=A0ACB7XBW8_9ERIC|nr:hypothetical protein Vadar_022268 [Vaccinium darrowii]
MLLPESKNVTILTIELSPWNSNNFAIPYPTYFHPSSDREAFGWQNKMRRLERRYLFSFAGAPRPNIGDSIRTEIMGQFQKARRKCKLLQCRDSGNKCLKPEESVKGNNLSIEAQLERIPKAKVVAMREEVVKLIPKVIYADPRSRLEMLDRNCFKFIIHKAPTRHRATAEATINITTEAQTSPSAHRKRKRPRS